MSEIEVKNASDKDHYLQAELINLVQSDRSIFEFIQAGSLDGLWYWDLENPEHEWMNEKFWQVLGFDPAEKKHFAQEWQDLIFQEDLEEALDNFHKHVEDPDHPYDQIVRYRKKDGATVWVRCRGLAIRDETGKPIRMLGAHTELTQLKATEERLRKSNAELEAFAYAASHDLKAPLKSISGQLQLLQDAFLTDLPADANTLMSNVHVSLDRMSNVIDGLLEYAQMANHELRCETFDLNELVAGILEDHHGDLKPIAATVFNGTNGMMHSSAVLVRHILHNLISNAVKYRRGDEPLQVNITSEESDLAWCLSVQDNGIGIAEQHQGRIFEFLQRLHTQDEIAGNGLGLCLVAKAAQHLGGSVSLTSKPGEGSTFSVTIPKGGGIENTVSSDCSAD